MDEKASRFLMGRFFADLQAGLPKDLAWQQAQLAYLNENPGNKHPFFWATLIPVGDMQPLKQGSIPWELVIGGMVLLLLVEAGWWRARRKPAA
jgi:hypothetical protein